MAAGRYNRFGPVMYAVLDHAIVVSHVVLLLQPVLPQPAISDPTDNDTVGGISCKQPPEGTQRWTGAAAAQLRTRPGRRPRRNRIL